MQKKRYRIFGNFAFVGKQIWGWDKLIVPILALQIPCRVLPPLLVLFLPTILLRAIRDNAAPPRLVAVVLCIAAVLVLLRFVQGRLDRAGDLKATALERHYDLLFCNKVMDMDFEIAEGPLGREKYQKAKNSLSYNGIYQYWGYFSYLLVDIFGIFSFGAIIAVLNPLVIVILLITQGLQFLMELWQRKLEDKSKDERARVDRRLNYLTKTTRDFSLGKDIRLYRMEEPLQRMNEDYVQKKKHWTNHVYLTYFLTDGSNEFLYALFRGGIYFYLIYALMQNKIDLSTFVLYLSAALGFTGWLSGIRQNLDNLLTANLCVGDMREFLDIPNEMTLTQGEPLPQDGPLQIELRNVCYTYPGADTPALENINLIIRPGEKLAIVGRNGAGKTTLVKMLCGLYRPAEGQVFVNGTDIARFNRDAYYTLFSCVFQDIRVMPVSVLHNVSMQTQEETDTAKAENCLRLAGLRDKIAALPDGLQTPLVKTVNENGAELSGGELQRLALARAVYKNAPILVLDEPTAALDAIAEHELYLRYSELSRNKTSVYISHRLSSTRFCDRILFIENARIVECGSHEELMRQNGLYANMFRVQSQYYRTQELKLAADEA